MMVTTNPNQPLSSSLLDPRQLWYAPNRHIRTEAASREAIRIAEGVAEPNPPDPQLDEHALFVALHTCAFRAARRDQGRQIPMKERRRWAKRWEDIRAYIVEQNLGLVYSMIQRIGRRQLDEDDLLSEAMLALTRAVDRFDPWRGYRFSTYACNVIARAIMRRGKQESRYRQLFPVQHDTSYEPSSGLPDLHAELYVERLQHVLDRNLGELTGLETTILTHRFPHGQGSRLTFREIGDAIGLSKERVRQIQNVALDKLREVLDADPILQ
jgi:RNA polymerase sigma factor (sigma-70 family)